MAERTISPLTSVACFAALVALVFMHLIRSPARAWVAAGLGLF